MASIKLDPPIDEDLGDNPRRVTFTTLEALDKWVEAEREAWEFLNDIVSNKLANYPVLREACNGQQKNTKLPRGARES